MVFTCPEISGQRRVSIPEELTTNKWATMNKEILPENNNEIGEGFLISVRRILQKLRAFCRFTEDDAFALLSAYGLCVFEANRLPDSGPNEQKKRNPNFDDPSHRNSSGSLPGPVPIGVHPDITRAKRTKDSQKHVHR